jgi:hypothetical protein
MSERSSAAPLAPTPFSPYQGLNNIESHKTKARLHADRYSGERLLTRLPFDLTGIGIRLQFCQADLTRAGTV